MRRAVGPVDRRVGLTSSRPVIAPDTRRYRDRTEELSTMHMLTYVKSLVALSASVAVLWLAREPRAAPPAPEAPSRQ